MTRGSRWYGYLLAGLVLTTVVSLPGSLCAQPRQEVVLVTLVHCCSNQSWPTAEARIEKELRLSNLNVVAADGIAAEDGRYSVVLEQITKDHGAVAGILVFRSPSTASAILSVYAVDAADAPNLQEMEIAGPLTDETAEIVALRAVEAARVVALNSPVVKTEPKTATPTSPKEQVSPPPVQTEEDRSAARAHARYRIQAKFLVEGTPGSNGVGAIGALGWDFRWIPFRQISLGLNGTLSVVGKDIENEDGSASASFDIMLARLNLAWEMPLEGLLRPSFGVAIGMGYIWSRGKKIAPEEEDRGSFKKQTSGSPAFFVGGFAELGLAVSKYISIPIRIGVGVLPSGVEVWFGGDKSEAEFGMPVMEGSAGIAVTL